MGHEHFINLGGIITGRRRNPPRYPNGMSPQLLTGGGGMKRIKVWVCIDKEGILQFDDDATDETIQDEVDFWIDERLSSWWEEI